MPRFEDRAPQRQRFSRDSERAALEMFGEFFGLGLFEFGEFRVRPGAPVQARLGGKHHEAQVQRAGIGHGCGFVEIAEPIPPVLDFLFALPLAHPGFDQTEIRDAIHEVWITRLAPAQFPRDVEPEMIIIARTFGPQFDFLPIIVSIASADNYAQIALIRLAVGGVGVKGLHLPDERGFVHHEFASEMFHEPVVKRRARRLRHAPGRFVFWRDEAGDGLFSVGGRALTQFKQGGHSVFAITPHRTRTFRRPLLIGKFQSHLIVFAAAHDRDVKVIRFDAFQFKHGALGVVGAPALARLGRREREEPVNALEQIVPQRHFRSSMKEAIRHDKPGLFTSVVKYGIHHPGGGVVAASRLFLNQFPPRAA